MHSKMFTAHVPISLAEKEHRRLTLAALADVDAGNVVDHQSVKAWAESLDTDKRCRFPSNAGLLKR